MPEYSSVRTGQLVVRYHAPWRRRATLIGAIVGAIILIYGTYEWGRFDGGYNVIAMVQERREHAAELEAMKRENATLRAQVTNADTARRVDKESYSVVEKTLSELQAKLQQQTEELTFYRGIVAPEDGVGGMKIQRLDVLPDAGDGRYKLRLVLMQSMRQDVVSSGTVRIEIEGSRAGQHARLSLADVGGSSKDSGDVAFSFRYFQNIEQDIAIPTDFEPSAVDVEVKSARQRQPLKQSFPWSVRAPG